MILFDGNIYKEEHIWTCNHCGEEIDLDRITDIREHIWGHGEENE